MQGASCLRFNRCARENLAIEGADLTQSSIRICAKVDVNSRPLSNIFFVQSELEAETEGVESR